ncbi:hypothetical protein HHK36_031245 [Tetracentron sinense]|uniref:Large ribosomal subunit protein mL53 n=1 Tax=Tetracentron sinense TaxID=13715 RepID=A0A834Y936_TETSI|nr:hypothetical protein HHK36_031245 [Tetracentron sinense]
MLKYLSKVRMEFNALDPRTAPCLEFLAQCNSRKAKESNPSCQLVVKRRTDDHPPQITVTFVDGVEEVIDAATTSAQNIRTMILEKGQLLETEQMFKDAGETWPVIIPEEEMNIHQRAPGTKEFLIDIRSTVYLEGMNTWKPETNQGQSEHYLIHRVNGNKHYISNNHHRQQWKGMQCTQIHEMSHFVYNCVTNRQCSALRNSIIEVPKGAKPNIEGLAS